MNAKVLFLDRDGTINIDKLGDYVAAPEELFLEPGAAQSLKKAKELGYKLAVITNQAGVGKGIYSEVTLKKIHEKMEFLVREETGMKSFAFDDIQYCPHLKEDKCSCRKPATDMIKRSQKKLEADMSRSYFIGDRDTDLICAKNAGLKSILVLTGYGSKTADITREWTQGKPVAIVASLKEAIDYLEKL